VTFSTISPLTITDPPVTGTQRVTSVNISYDSGIKGTLSMAWLGPWGNVEYTPVTSTTAGQGTASVPMDLSGHVWGVLMNATGHSASNLAMIVVTGPEMVWVTQP